MRLQAKERLRLAEEAEASGNGRRADPFVMLAEQPRERWDCESVLSMRSNLDNHPGRIAEPGQPRRRPRTPSQQSVSTAGGRHITLSAKTGLPVGVLSGGKAPQHGERAKGPAEGSVASVQSRKGETPEEKKARKAAVKEANVRCTILFTSASLRLAPMGCSLTENPHHWTMSAHTLMGWDAEAGASDEEGAQGHVQGRAYKTASCHGDTGPSNDPTAVTGSTVSANNAPLTVLVRDTWLSGEGLRSTSDLLPCETAAARQLV